MFELVDVERRGRESIWVINRLAKREVFNDSIANYREYCIVCDLSRMGANKARGGCNHHLSCLCE